MCYSKSRKVEIFGTQCTFKIYSFGSVVCLCSSPLWLHSLSCSPRKSEGVCFYWRLSVCMSVCLSVTMITKKIVDGFVPNFMGRFLGGNGRPSSCSVMIGRETWKYRSKNSVNWRLFTFYTSNSRCDKCCQVLATKPPNLQLGSLVAIQ